MSTFQPMTATCVLCRVSFYEHDDAGCPSRAFSLPDVTFPAYASLPDPPCGRCTKPLSQCYCGALGPHGAPGAPYTGYCLSCGNLLTACSCLSVTADMWTDPNLDPLTLPLPPTRTDDWKTKDMHIQWVRRNFTPGMLAKLYKLSYDADHLRRDACDDLIRKEKG
jgi:hypothetical protein